MNRIQEQELASDATAVRQLIVSALSGPQGGHFGGSLSLVEILLAIFQTFSIQSSPGGPGNGDRLILSKGHGAVALYAVLEWLKRLDTPLEDYGCYGSPLQGHPDVNRLPQVGFSTGSLGLGLGVALGMGLACRNTPTHTLVVLGDGECQEGSVWESALLVARYKLNRVIAVVDANGRQECPTIDGTDPVPALAKKWRAFGWRVVECDGHSPRELQSALAFAKTSADAPAAIIARTLKGRGSALIENDPARFHCASVTPAELQTIVSQVQNGQA